MGVRISWLMFARNWLFVSVAFSASSFRVPEALLAEDALGDILGDEHEEPLRLLSFRERPRASGCSSGPGSSTRESASPSQRNVPSAARTGLSTMALFLPSEEYLRREVAEARALALGDEIEERDRELLGADSRQGAEEGLEGGVPHRQQSAPVGEGDGNGRLIEDGPQDQRRARRIVRHSSEIGLEDLEGLLEDLIGLERLDEVALDARLEGAHDRLALADRREDYHGQLDVLGAEPRQDLEAVHARHEYVEEDEVEALGLDRLDELASVW